MGALRGVPLAAMLLIAVIPYQAWSQFGGSYPPWHAHRIVLLACGILLCLGLLLRWGGVRPAKIGVALTLPVLALLLPAVGPIVVTVTLAAAVLAGLLDRQRRFENANLALVAMGAVLLFGAAKPIVEFTAFEEEVVAVPDDSAPFSATEALRLSQTPSIVHIVLDGYGSAETLRSIYDHDPRPFFAQLEERGFTVIENAISPFSQTLPSMASVMSGAPVDVSGSSSRGTALRRNLGHTIRNGPVPQILEQAGYTFARTESGYHFLDFDDTRIVASSPLRMSLLDAHLLRGVGSYFGAVHNEGLRAALSPGTLADLPRPFFYYQHLIAPHPPFTIAADGSTRETHSSSFADGNHMATASAEQPTYYFEGYREKARFIEASLMRQINSLPDGPMIIVIHGDHGPGAFLDHENASVTCMSERLTTFVAVYSDIPEVPERLSEKQGDGFSIVNIYRAIIGALSDSEIPLVEPQSSFLPWSDPTSPTAVSSLELSQRCNGRST